MRNALDALRRFWCGIHGHDTYLLYEEDRLALRCVSCGYESPGWTLNLPSATVTLCDTWRR